MRSVRLPAETDGQFKDRAEKSARIAKALVDGCLRNKFVQCLIDEGRYTGGFSIYIGVGTSRMCDFKRGRDGDLPGVAIVVPVTEVIADRRAKYEEDGSVKHLEYEKAFGRELRKKGRENPEIRRNFYLEDMVEEGNFVSRERLLSCARGPDILVPFDTLFLGLV